MENAREMKPKSPNHKAAIAAKHDEGPPPWSIDWLLIDGYSLLHQDPACSALLARDLGLARQRLVRRVETLAANMARRITIVFDGRGQGGAGVDEPLETPLEIYFAPGHLTADSVIERWIGQHPQPETICVVTADQAEIRTVTAAGAEYISCTHFLQRTPTPPSSCRRPSFRRGTLGDFFPQE